MLVLLWWCVCYVCVVQVGDGASVGSADFGSTDARLRGLCGGMSGAKQKSGTKLATNFATPLTPKPSRSSASEGEGKKIVKGEKSKVKKRSSPPNTPIVDGAFGGCGSNESSTDDQGASGPTSCFTKESLAKLCRHLGDGRGECVVVLFMALFFLCRC